MKHTTITLTALAAATLFTSSLASAQVQAATRIAEGTGGFPAPLAAGDLFGWATCQVGDLDGDGAPEVAISSFLDDEGEPDAGAVYIGTMMPDGSLDGAVKITEGLGGFTGDLDVADFFGTSLAPLGDLDGDGVPDLAVGAYYDDDGGPDFGAVWILFLEPDGTVKSHSKISTTSGGFTGSLATEDWFGWSMATLGDLESDGLLELAVGADGDDDGAPDAGAVYILSLTPFGTVDHHVKLSATTGGDLPGLVPFAWFGSSLANLGDVDGDGVTDIVVGSDGDAAAGPSTGAAYVVFLFPDGSSKGFTELSVSSGGLLMPPAGGDQFGRSAGGPGDLDFDGVPDLLIGADKVEGVLLDSGGVHVILLLPDGTVKDQFLLNDLNCVIGSLLVSGDQFGNAIGVLDDLDGNGLPEFLIGAHLTDGGSSAEGAAYTVFLGFSDCNGNGIDDVCDLISGTSTDHNDNGTPDECEEIGDITCLNAVNSTGSAAGILASGSSSAAANDFQVSMYDLAPGEFGYFIASMSVQSIAHPGGSDGTLCIGPGFARFAHLVAAASPAGVITSTLDLTAFPANPTVAVTAGETWHFQGWYRDPGAISNFTSVVSVTFD